MCPGRDEVNAGWHAWRCGNVDDVLPKTYFIAVLLAQPLAQALRRIAWVK
jgi:hypothetical protein